MKPDLRKTLTVACLLVVASSSRCIGQDSPDASAGTALQRQRSLESVVKLDDHPLYQMTWYGDYSVTVPPAHAEPPDSADGDYACTLFAAMGNRNQTLFGRNFDWQHNPALVLFTDTSTGFATVTMVDISYLGYEAGDPDLETIEGRAALLEATSIPFDGLNEHGLFVGMAAVDESPGPFDQRRPTVGSLRMIRLILDECRTVDEAVQVFARYNIDFTGGPNIHYLVADAAGRSAVVELHEGELKVSFNETPWQVATNFYLAPNRDRAIGMCDRFARVSRKLEAARGAITVPRALELLGDVAQPNTRWSCVYDSQQAELHLVMSRNFHHPLRLKLSDHRPASDN